MSSYHNSASDHIVYMFVMSHRLDIDVCWVDMPRHELIFRQIDAEHVKRSNHLPHPNIHSKQYTQKQRSIQYSYANASVTNDCNVFCKST